MIFIRLYWEFFKTGLFAVGGGMATLPFLQDIGESTGWYTYADLMNMLAVSESTPGPIGINMATYVGFTIGGVPGAVIATIGEVTPSIIVILIGAAGVTIILEVLTHIESLGSGDGIINHFALESGMGLADILNWPALALAAVILVLTNWVKPTKNLHPIIFIVISAVVGVVFHFGGV